MKWFRSGQRGAKRSPLRPSARPSVEVLEGRNLLNASVAFSAAGNMAQVVVFAPASGDAELGGNAFLYTNSGAALIGTGVRVAHVFRDANGKIGLDIVYANTAGNPGGGVAFEFDSTGGRLLGTNVLDASRAYDAKGNFVLDVIYADPSSPSPGAGNLFQYTNTGATFGGRNIYFASAFVDPRGVFGNAYGFLDTNSPSPGSYVSRAFVVDSLGARLLVTGFFSSDVPDISTAIQDYDQANDAAGQPVVDVTTANLGFVGFGVSGQAGNAQQFSAAGATGFGMGNIEPF